MTTASNTNTVVLVCSTCKESKPTDQFYNDKSKRGFSYQCRPCQKARTREWHSKRENKDKRNARVNYKQVERKQWAVDYMGGKCNDCGGVFPLCVYDFHHVDMTTKENNPSYFIKLSREKAMEELAKCVMLCANCHRVRHFG